MTKYIVYMVIFISLFALFYVAISYFTNVSTDTAIHNVDDDTTANTEYKSEGNKRNFLCLTYVTSHECEVCTNNDHINDVKNVIKRFESLSERNYTVCSIGVSIGNDVNSSIRHLTQFGPFDEINVGRGWFSMGAEKFIWDDLAGTPAVPQVIIFKGSYSIRADWITSDSIGLVERKVGVREIKMMSHRSEFYY